MHWWSQALSNFYIQLTVAAVLDWELSTLGDPILDLAYNCVPYHCPSELTDVLPAFSLGEFYQACLSIPKVFHFSSNCNNNMSWKMLLKGLTHCYITKATSAPTNIKSFYSLTVLASPSAGIPSEKELVSTYCKLRGFSKTSFPNWNFYLALSFFRMAAIAQV